MKNDGIRRTEAEVGGEKFIVPTPADLFHAIDALFTNGDPDSLKILSLVDRLFSDDWTGSGVYEALDEALKNANPSTGVTFSGTNNAEGYKVGESSLSHGDATDSKGNTISLPSV